MDELKRFIVMYGVDIVCVTESHLSEDIKDAEIEINGYSSYRADRDFNLDISNDTISDGGGSIIYCRNRIKAIENKTFKKAPDSVAIDIETTYGKICLACIYRSTSLPDSKNDILLDCIMNICNESNNFETILTGDFNLPDVSWANGLVSGCSVTNKFLNLQLEYLDLFTQKGLKWYLTNEITRRRMVAGTLQESLLDQVLSTNDALVSSFKILSPLGKSDHVCINIDLGISFGNDSYVNKEVIRKPCWSKVSKDNILNFSSENINWSYSSYNLNVEEMWKELHGKLSKFIDIVPTARFDSSNQPLKPLHHGVLLL